jgi:hypothetical protein
MITLAEQAEAYIKHEQRERNDNSGSRSLSRSEYDLNKSRREWSQSVQ